METKFKYTALAAAIAIALSGCGGGGGGTSTSTDTGTGDTTGTVTGTGQLNSDGEEISTLTRGFSLPSEISAVPADGSTTSASTSSFSRSIHRLARAAADLPTESDYKTTKAKRYVEERALEQFDIIEQVLNAVSQTNYSEEAVINLGPYSAMVSWVEDRDGREVKTLEKWVVDSRMVVIDGQNVNRILAWIEEPDYESSTPGATRLTKAEFKIYEAANANDDGSYADYGSWDLNVSFDESATSFFAASSRVNNGETTLKINQSDTRLEQMGPGDPIMITSAMKGILIRGANGGYGRVEYPDWESCHGMDGPSPDCADGTIPTKEASYAYNADYLAVKDNGFDVVYKDRDPANAVEMVHRYGMFYDESATGTDGAGATINPGDNVEKHVQFGFPIDAPLFTRNSTTNQCEEVTGAHSFAYYGAWQGRHEIWSGGGDCGLPAGTTVQQGDQHDPNATPVQYTTSDLFNGTLTKRTVADGSLSDILNIQVETWINKHWDLTWDQASTSWLGCAGWVEDQWTYDPNTMMSYSTGKICRGFAPPGQPAPDIGFTTFTNFDMLVPDDSGRKWVNVGGWDDQAQMPIELVYDPNGASGAGFYIGTMVNGQYGPQIQSTGTKFNPADGTNIWVDVSGSIYIQYTGDYTGNNTGWVQKELLSFDQETWTPTFGTNDTPFSPETGREYYINNNGASFIVKRVAQVGDATDYKVMIELQSAANPVNIASILPAGTSYLAAPWRPEVQYTFVTDSSNANFMKLIYKTDDPNTADVNEGTTPTVYENGEWGLNAYNASGAPLMADGTAVQVNEWGEPIDQNAGRPTQFNWEYSQEGWGSQQFLLDGNGNYVILNDPIALDPITIDHNGTPKTLSLQFDGWFHGLPDMYRLLEDNNWVMDASIAEKVVSVPKGTAVSSNGVGFYIKPLEVSVFLDLVTAADITAAGGTVPDITSGQAVDLTDVPTYVAHGMGAMPTGTSVLYSECLPVE